MGAKIKAPSSEAINTAVEWLRINEGDCGEAEECEAVAQWLLAWDDARDLRKTARDNRVPIRVLREALATKP
jgi:hypothetical protein